MKFLKLIAVSAVLLASAPASADKIDVGGWSLERNPTNCSLYARFIGGTTFMVMADVDAVANQHLDFIVQNKKWTSLKDGAQYKFGVEFDSRGEWPVTGIAATDLDADGPGFIFRRSIKTNSDGDNFLAEFALSKAIHIRRNGTAIDNLDLSGTRDATMAMTRCMRNLGGKGDPFAGDTPDVDPTPKTST